VSVRVCMSVRVCVSVRRCVCGYVCVSVCVFVCVRVRVSDVFAESSVRCLCHEMHFHGSGMSSAVGLYRSRKPRTTKRTTRTLMHSQVWALVAQFFLFLELHRIDIFICYHTYCPFSAWAATKTMFGRSMSTVLSFHLAVVV